MLQDLTFYAPIDKADKKNHMVYGYASTEALDSQGEIVKKDALSLALADYMRFANIREMHQPSAVGKTKTANLDKKGLYIAAKVIDPLAWEKVEEGVYNGFSIGGRVKTMDGNEITGLTLSEISLVDRPANPDAVFDVWKADGAKPEAKKEEVVEEKPVEEVKEIPVVEEKEEVKEEVKEVPAEEVKEVEEVPEVKVEEVPVVEEKETEEVVEVTPEKADKPTLMKDTWGADRLIDLACNLTSYIYNEKVEGHDVANLEGALQEIKNAAATELNEADDYPASLMPMVEMAEKALDIKKVETTETVEEIKDDKTILFEKVDSEILTGKMPSDEDLTAMLKAMDIDANEKTLSVLKFELAGKIIDHISKNMKVQADADMKKKELEKVQAEEKAAVDTVPHEWDQVKLVVKKLEKIMKEDAAYKPQDAPVLPAAPDADMSTQTGNITEALSALQNAVKTLSDANIASGLTDEQKALLTNGIKALSEMTSVGGYKPKADTSTTLEKMETTIKTLEEKIEKLEKMPMPVKAYASYMTINKFDESQTAQKETLLTKIEEVSQRLKENPQDSAIQAEAQSLTAEWQKFSRGEYGSHN